MLVLIFRHTCDFVSSGGIPPPIYFGALIDRTCLKWGTKQCGGRGACRLYDANAFRYGKIKIQHTCCSQIKTTSKASIKKKNSSLSSRYIFVGLISGVYCITNMVWGVLYVKIVKKEKKLALSQAKENELEANGESNGHANISIAKNKDDTTRESTI